jgi:hypothetical protein
LDFAIPHQLVNDVARVSYGPIAVPKTDASLVFDVATPVQYFESVCCHAVDPKRSQKAAARSLQLSADCRLIAATTGFMLSRLQLQCRQIQVRAAMEKVAEY